jgi:hypothetical protein
MDSEQTSIKGDAVARKGAEGAEVPMAEASR